VAPDSRTPRHLIVLATWDRGAPNMDFACSGCREYDQPLKLSSVQPNTPAPWTTINFNSLSLDGDQIRARADGTLPGRRRPVLGLIPMPLVLHFDQIRFHQSFS
jgi:hypothetical protein